jgi:restriction endonuclease S subunit
MLYFIYMNCSTAYNPQPLSAFASISAGYPLRGAVDALPIGDVAVVQMGNVHPDAGIDWTLARRVTLPSKRSTAVLGRGDVIFTTRGTRNFALALDDVPGTAVCSPHFFVLQVRNPGHVIPEFLAWQINQRPAQEYFQREATGSYILNIRRDVLENLPLVVPPLPQQHAIIAFADAAKAESLALNNLIANRNQQMEAIALDLHRFERPPE